MSIKGYSHHDESMNAELCSRNLFVNYSFFMTQQFHYPNDPLQLGSILFDTLRKCAIFGGML